MSSSGVRVALFVVDAFVALAAIGGGITLMAGLEANRFPLEMLRRTPFTIATPVLLLWIVLTAFAHDIQSKIEPHQAH